MNKIKLYGELAVNFNNEYLYDSANLRESISALFSQEKELKNHILSSKKYYQITLEKNNTLINITPEINNLKISNSTIHITPSIEGSGRGFFTGLLFVGLGVLTGMSGFIMAGISMGLQSLFGGNPDAPNDENSPQSDIISGGSLNTAEGNAIAIGCGESLLSNPQVLSVAIKTEYTSI